MELTHTFTVPASLEETWTAFNDIEGVASCFPGAAVSSVEGDEFLFDLASDPRERANYRKREPKIFGDLKAKYEAWHAAMPPIPMDALVSIPYTKADLTWPSGSPS